MPEHSPADLALMEKLREIRDTAKHAADPREATANLAAALLDWFEAE